MVAVQLPPGLPFFGNCEKSHVAEVSGTKQLKTKKTKSGRNDLRFCLENFSIRGPAGKLACVN